MSRPRTRGGPAAASLFVLAGLCAGQEAPEAAADAPTFARDVAPILHARCAACHHPEGSGPFPLIDYEDARKRARQIAQMTREREMPPWGPVPGHGEFLDARRLSDAELAAIEGWYRAGAPLGDPEELPEPPTFSSRWELGEPDLVLAMAEPYVVPAEGFDVWRTFVIPTGFEEDRYLRAVEYRVANQRVLHHFIMYMDTSGDGRRRDAAEPGVGYEGMTAEVSLRGEEAFGWIPGMHPRAYPKGVATTVRSGTDFILDAHFTPTGREESVRIEVGLHLAEEPPTRFPTGVILLGPGATIPPGAAEYTISQSVTLPVDVRAINVAPHAHYVCERVETFAVLPDGRRVELLLIDHWDPDWQEIYAYREPVDLPAGTRVEMRFTYDNSTANEQNPFDPPRRIITGKAAYNEMAVVWLNATVDSREALETLKEHLNRDYFASIRRATRLIDMWKALVHEYDADRDGTLDPEEDARATAYVNRLLDHPGHLRAGFDANGDGSVDGEERAFAERVVAYWNGRPVE